MKIDICGEGAEVLRSYITYKLREVMGGLCAHICWARIKLADVVGDGVVAGDKRCVVQLRLRNLPNVMFTITRLDVRSAIDAAVVRAAQMLTSRLKQGGLTAGGREVHNLALA